MYCMLDALFYCLALKLGFIFLGEVAMVFFWDISELFAF